MKEGDYEGDYLGGWRGRAARLQKPPPRVRADSGKSAGVGGHVTSHPAGGASHLSPGMGTATSLLRRRANPPRTLGREEVGQGEPATPAPAPSRQPLGAERVGRAQACTPGLDSGGVGSPRRPRQHPPPLVLALMVGPPTAAHPRSAWPPAGLATSCVWSPPPDTPTQHPAAAEDGAAGGVTHGALTPSTLRKTWVPALRHIVNCASRSLMAPKPAC